LGLLTMAGAAPYWKASAMTMETASSPTDRFRPLVTDGGTVEGLSLPQHDASSEPHAEHRQNDRLVTTHDASACACAHVQRNMECGE
jgi:hypothetical protein